MSGYTNYQLPPNYGYQQQQQQYQQQQQPQYPSQYPSYGGQSSYDAYPKPAPAPVSAPLPSDFYQPTGSPAPSMYSASTMSSYGASSYNSSDDLIGMFNSPPPMNPAQAQAPRPVTPESKPMKRPAANNDMHAIVASQERAIVESKQTAMVQRKDYSMRKDTKGKHVISDAIHPEKYVMKKARKQNTAAGAASGAIVGGLLAGPAFPVGMALGAAAGGYASNKMHKFQERRRQRRHEQRNFQKAAKNTVVAKSDFVAFV